MARVRSACSKATERALQGTCAVARPTDVLEHTFLHDHAYRRHLRELQTELVKFRRDLIKRGDHIQDLLPGAAASITSFLAIEVASPADTRDMGDAPETSRDETRNCDRSDDLGKDGILVSERYEVSNDPADEPDPGYCNIIHGLSPLCPLA